MKKWLVLFLISLTVTLSIPVLAIECDGTPPSDPSQLIDYIKNCNEKINESKGQQYTLNSAIIVLNSKINLAQGQINQTQAQIDGLEQEISLLSTILVDLNKSLDELSVTYAARVRESYKQRDLNPLRLFFSSDSFGQLIIKLKYFNSVKTRDRLILQELEKARLDFDQQKLTKENKQQEVEDLKTKLVGQRVALGGQKSQKQELLTITKNDEQKFQQLLTEAARQYEAYQDAIAGKGEETEMGKVEENQKIASIIQGPSVCSYGTHLHFEVYGVDPFSRLQSKSVTWDLCGWFGCDDPVSFTGDWSWPINDPVTVTQNYGLTAFARTGAYGYYDPPANTNPRPHTGVDIFSSDLSIKSVKSGTLFRGSIYVSKCVNKGGYLRYVRVQHEDGNMTYYFHVNYL